MKKVRAKFTVEHIEDWGGYQKVFLKTEYSDNPEDNEFCKATPYGECMMQIDNEEVFGFLKPDKSYYLDFIETE